MKRIILLIGFLSLLACNNDDLDVPVIAACNTTNPIEDLAWLKTQVNEIKNGESDTFKYFYIEIAEYQNQTIFVSNNCCSICGTVVPIYNCKGEQLGFLGGEITTDELTNKKTIFRRDDFPCQTN